MTRPGRLARWAVLLCLLCTVGSAAFAESSSPTDQGATPAFDVAAATEAYLAKMPADKRAKSDAYFEGGYWLQLWGFLYGLGVAWVMLGTGLSVRVRDLARRLGRKKPLETALYWVMYLPIVTLLAFPLTVYEGYFREHQYGLATQTFGPWLWDQTKGLGVGLVMGALFLPILYGVFRRATRTWWIWGAAVMLLFMTFGALIAPVYINPIFNKYTKLADATVRDPILSMARANGIPATNVYEMDASRQTTRVSANVSGLFGTERITLNDNLLKRCSLAEIQSVMAHEMGHYVLNHVYELILEFGIVIVLGFAWVRWGMARALARWGAKWRLEGLGDVASFPLLIAVFSIFFLVMTPVTNSIIRVNEVEADIFGLNAAGQPDGFAETALKLGEYRKMAPGPLEEIVFFDHPSGKNRIQMAMQWKAEHLGEPAEAAPVPSPPQ